MMSEDQAKAVKEIYKNFISHDERRKWTKIDYLLHDLDSLNDNQMILEVEVQLYLHSMGILKCAEDHGESVCLVPQLMESVNAICDLYQETLKLHPKNRYILQNYLAISHEKIIYVDSDK